jgi:hypothetical protein
VAVIRSSSAVIREHLSCEECPSGYTFDSNSKACKKEGATDVPPSCATPKGMGASMGATGATGAAGASK